MFFLSTLLILSLFSISFSAFANNSLLSQEELIIQVEHLFKQNAETLNYRKVIELSNKIINPRSNYPSEIVAKTYLLLANVASNKGELETALQFINDGLAVAAKKQYQQLLTTVQQVIDSPQNKQNSKNFLLALSYRSVAFAMLGQHVQALIDLQKVEAIIQQDAAFPEHIALLAGDFSKYLLSLR
ncbi:MAG: hypothetical protein HRT51_05670 [Colwellia sp.]|nr:hypothetical protein [Colwellia sp.]